MGLSLTDAIFGGAKAAALTAGAALTGGALAPAAAVADASLVADAAGVNPLKQPDPKPPIAATPPPAAMPHQPMQPMQPPPAAGSISMQPMPDQLPAPMMSDRGQKTQVIPAERPIKDFLAQVYAHARL